MNQIQTKSSKNRQKKKQARLIKNEISKLHDQANKDRDYTLVQATNDFINKNGFYSQADAIAKRTGNRQPEAYYYQLGAKMFKEVLSNMTKSGVQVQPNDYKTLEILLLADDWFDTISHGIQTVAPHVIPFVQEAVRNYAPGLMNTINSFTSPLSTSSSDGQSIVVRKRWLMTSAQAPVAFVPIAVKCSPARPQFGAWLSQLSKCYQYYRVKRMTIEYVSTVAVTTTAQISYYLDLDLHEKIPDYNEIPQQFKAQAHACYNNSKVQYDESELQRLFRRYKIEPHPDDQVLPEFDFGIFYFGSSSTIMLGNFYVDAEIEFSIPTFRSDIDFDLTSSRQFSDDQFAFEDIIKTIPFINDHTRLTGEVRVSAYQSIQRSLYARITNTKLDFTQTIFYSGTNSTACNLQYRFYKSSTLSGSLSSLAVQVYSASRSTSGNQYGYYVFNYSIPAGVFIWYLPSVTGAIETPTGLYIENFLETTTSVLSLTSLVSNHELFKQFMQYTKLQNDDKSVDPDPLIEFQSQDSVCENGA